MGAGGGRAEETISINICSPLRMASTSTRNFLNYPAPLPLFLLLPYLQIVVEVGVVVDAVNCCSEPMSFRSVRNLDVLFEQLLVNRRFCPSL